MITEKDHIGQLFGMIAEYVHDECTLFMIGGGALMTRGLKNFTKDVDLVTKDDASYMMVDHALEEAGFKPTIPGDEYSRLELSNIYVKDEFRVDLFSTRVCHKLSLSDEMVRRSDLYGQFGKIRLMVCSLEDILLFKSITEREGDYEDCKNICRSGIDWDAVLEESVSQSKEEHEVWITYICGCLMRLSEDGYNIPIPDSIKRMNDAFMKNWIEKMENYRD